MAGIVDASTYRWAVLGLWFVCSVAGVMMVVAVGILLPAISADLGLTPTRQGLFGSSAFLGNLFLALPLSWWTSRYGPKILTTATLVLGIVFLSIQSLAPTFAILLIGRMGFGVATLAREPARALLMQQWFAPKEFIMVNGVHNALFGIIVGGGLVATSFILSAFGDDWRAVLYAFVTILTALTIIWMVLGKEQMSDEYRSREVPREVGLLRGALNYPELWLAGFGFMGATMGWSAFLSFFPTLMLDVHQVSLHWSGVILGLGIVVGGVVGLVLSHIVTVIRIDRRKNVIQTLGILMMITYLGMTLVGSIPLLLIIAALNGVAWGVWPILSTVPFHLRGIRPREVAVALSLMMTIASLGVVLGPSITGILYENLGDLRPALLIVCFAPLSLTVAGTLLRIGAEVDRAEQGS